MCSSQEMKVIDHLIDVGPTEVKSFKANVVEGAEVLLSSLVFKSK